MFNAYINIEISMTALGYRSSVGNGVHIINRHYSYLKVDKKEATGMACWSVGTAIRACGCTHRPCSHRPAPPWVALPGSRE